MTAMHDSSRFSEDDRESHRMGSITPINGRKRTHTAVQSPEATWTSRERAFPGFTSLLRQRLVGPTGVLHVHEQEFVGHHREGPTCQRPDPTQWWAHSPVASAGPNDLAGFMDAPVSAPPATVLAPTRSPVSSGPVPGGAALLGSRMVAQITSSSVNVNTASAATPWTGPTPSASACTGVAAPPVRHRRRRHAREEPASWAAT
uniref:Uncharacterized protein n=1 Tax=Oryza rufipogon TaxID=4529 RepID=A0A0E0MTI8_ORYRU